MRRVVLNGFDAREKLHKGSNFLADCVKTTLGPAGQKFLLEKGLKITKDGISVAKEIQSNDEIEDLGIRITREVCVKTNDKAGDGTTSAIVLFQAILNSLTKLLTRRLPNGTILPAKMSPISLTTKVKAETEEILTKLKESATPVASERQMIEVARVSVEYPELAEMIGKMQWELGPEGTILPELSAEDKDSIEKIKGIRIDNGFGASMVINNAEKQSLELENVHVIFTNHTLHNLLALANEQNTGILNQLTNNKVREVVIVARAFNEEAIYACQENTKRGFKIYPINAPYTDQVEVMKDMAAVLGGTFINCEETALEDMTLSDVGFATKVTAYRYNAIFTGEGKGIEERVRTLELEKKGDVSDFSKAALSTRIAQMTNGFALLKVTGTSDAERKDRYDKAVDGCNAVKSALQEGTVKGGGLALKEIADTLPDTYLLKEPIKAPYNQIQANAGEEIVIEPWVRDSLKSVRIGLEQAASGAMQLATTFGAASNEFPKPIDSVIRQNIKSEE